MISLRQLRDKIQHDRIDGVVHINDWLTAPSHGMKLFKYDCGALFLLEYRSGRIKIDQEIINALNHIEQRIDSFLIVTSQ